MSKFTYTERTQIKNIVATLSLKRIPDNEIIKEIFEQTNKTMTVRNLMRIRQSIKLDSYKWLNKLRQDQYSYVHEFRELINDIMSLQKKAHQIIDANEHNPQIRLTAMGEVHKLNITLSNYVEIIPNVINGPSTISTNAQDKAIRTEESDQSTIITV